MSTHLRIVVPELLLPRPQAADLCVGMRLPALETILARAQRAALPDGSLEAWLCRTFGAGAVAPVTLAADGLAPEHYYWLRADPVHLRIVHDQLLLQPVSSVGADEAAQLTAALNRHFADQGLHFVAPHPLRWYLRLEQAPQIDTVPLSQVAGRNVRYFEPQGADGLRWHSLLNEFQMLLFSAPANAAREQRGDLAINGLWLWGGGRASGELARPYPALCTDSPLAAAFAAAAGIGHAALPDGCLGAEEGDALVVWDALRSAVEQGDLGAWREALQRFERDCAAPAWQALRSGKFDEIRLEVPQPQAAGSWVLSRRAAWQFWRRRRRLSNYSIV